MDTREGIRFVKKKYNGKSGKKPNARRGRPPAETPNARMPLNMRVAPEHLEAFKRAAIRDRLPFAQWVYKALRFFAGIDG